MTSVGVHRIKYAQQVETAPSRFSDVAGYAKWAERADAWAEVNA